MSNILLLRSPSETSPDPYDSALRNALYSPCTIAVLETSFTNLSELQNLLSAGPQPRNYIGIIITSKRSCEAWIAALRNEQFLPAYSDHNSSTKLQSSLEAWTRIPFYVVGKSTASALEDFQTICSSLGASSKLDIRGDHTGTGEQLARFILDDIKEDNISSTKRLLYLTGDKNRDTIPKILSSEEGKRRGIELDTVQVYETHGASSFEPSLNSHLERSPKGNWWIVFFAPSSAEFAYPILQRHFRFTQSESSSTDPVSPHPPLAKIAAIGRVTSSYLEEELKLHVDAVATKPTPEALLAAITTTTT